MQASASSLHNQPRLRTLTVISIMMFFIGFEMGGFQLILRRVTDSFRATVIMMGFLATAQHLGVIIMPALFGQVADRIGKKRVLVIFAAVFVLGCIIAALSGGIPIFALGVLFIGAGYSVCECTGTAALADQYPENSTRFINLSQCMLSLGAVISPILINAGIRNFGWTWRVMFCICASAYGLLLLVLLRTDIQRSLVSEIQSSKKHPIRIFFTSRIYLLLFISILLYVGLENGFGYFTESLFALRLNSEQFGVYAISAYWLCMTVSRLLFSILRLPVGKMLVYCLGASFMLLLVLALTDIPVLSLVACGLIGFAFGPVWSALVDSAIKQFPQNSGGAIGLMSTGCGIGGAVFPTMMGFMADRFDLSVAFAMLAITALIACILCWIIQQKNKKSVLQGVQ